MPRSATTDFEPLDLSVDDLLPTDIELVMGYRGELAAEHCAAALERGLGAFPHLIGKLEGMRIVPSVGGFALELVPVRPMQCIRGILRGMLLNGVSDSKVIFGFEQRQRLLNSLKFSEA